jgi:hypothetical protein
MQQETLHAQMAPVEASTHAGVMLLAAARTRVWVLALRCTYTY